MKVWLNLLCFAIFYVVSCTAENYRNPYTPYMLGECSFYHSQRGKCSNLLYGEHTNSRAHFRVSHVAKSAIPQLRTCKCNRWGKCERVNYCIQFQYRLKSAYYGHYPITITAKTKCQYKKNTYRHMSYTGKITNIRRTDSNGYRTVNADVNVECAEILYFHISTHGRRLKIGNISITLGKCY